MTAITARPHSPMGGTVKLYQVIAVPQGANLGLRRPKVVATHIEDERACQEAWEATRGRGDDAPEYYVRTVRGLGLIKALPSLLRTLRALRD